MRLAGEAKETGDQSCVMPDGGPGRLGQGVVSRIAANNAGRSVAEQALAGGATGRRPGRTNETAAAGLEFLR